MYQRSDCNGSISQNMNLKVWYIQIVILYTQFSLYIYIILYWITQFAKFLLKKNHWGIIKVV